MLFFFTFFNFVRVLSSGLPLSDERSMQNSISIPTFKATLSANIDLEYIVLEGEVFENRVYLSECGFLEKSGMIMKFKETDTFEFRPFYKPDVKCLIKNKAFLTIDIMQDVRYFDIKGQKKHVCLSPYNSFTRLKNCIEALADLDLKSKAPIIRTMEALLALEHLFIPKYRYQLCRQFLWQVQSYIQELKAIEKSNVVLNKNDIIKKYEWLFQIDSLSYIMDDLDSQKASVAEDFSKKRDLYYKGFISWFHFYFESKQEKQIIETINKIVACIKKVEYVYGIENIDLSGKAISYAVDCFQNIIRLENERNNMQESAMKTKAVKFDKQVAQQNESEYKSKMIAFFNKDFLDPINKLFLDLGREENYNLKTEIHIEGDYIMLVCLAGMYITLLYIHHPIEKICLSAVFLIDLFCAYYLKNCTHFKHDRPSKYGTLPNAITELASGLSSVNAH